MGQGSVQVVRVLKLLSLVMKWELSLARSFHAISSEFSRHCGRQACCQFQAVVVPILVH